MDTPNKVMIVNDSPVLIAIMTAIVETEPSYQITATAGSGTAALENIHNSMADLVLMDIHMPGMDGVETTRKLLVKFPKLRILITTATIKRNQIFIFHAMQAGAVDFVKTPALKQTAGSAVSIADLREAGKLLLHKMQMMKQIKLHTQIAPTISPKIQQNRSVNSVAINNHQQKVNPSWLCIGSSTGGPTTLVLLINSLLKALKVTQQSSCPLTIVICQHIEAGFSHGLADWLAKETGLIATEVTKRISPKSGQIYVAQGGKDLLALSGGELTVATPDKDALYKPNIDRFFSSAAEFHGHRTIGVVLTGMGKDGAQGLAQIQKMRGAVYAQSEASSIISSMPIAAKKATGLKQSLTPDQIGGHIARLITKKPVQQITKNK